MKKFILIFILIFVFKLSVNGQIDSVRNNRFIFSIGFSSGTLKNEPNFPFATTYFINLKNSNDFPYKNALVENSKGWLPFRPFFELKYISKKIDYNLGLGALHTKHNYASIFDLYTYLEGVKYVFSSSQKKQLNPFIGLKISYLKKKINDGNYEDALSINNQINTNAYSLQIPIGIAINRKHLFTTIQIDLSFLSFIYGNYTSELSGTNSNHSPPDPLIHYSEKEKGNYNKLLFINNLLKDGYFINRITFKIGYKFS